KFRERLSLLDPFIDCCQALAYAHSKGILHRDLKPDNIMLGRYGQSLVVDWGLAKVRGEDEEIDREIRSSSIISDQIVGQKDLTQVGTIIGTPAYLSPEQARGDNTRVSSWSDIFSLGAILFEIVTGKSPIQGQTSRERLYNAAMCDYLSIEEICPEAPKELVAIIMRTLAKSPEERWQSADDLADELANWRNGGQVSIYHYSSYELLKRFVARNKGKLIAASLMLAVTGVLLGYNAWQAHQFDEEKRLEAERQAKAAEAEYQSELAQRQSALDAINVELRSIEAKTLQDYATSAVQATLSNQASYDPSLPVPVSTSTVGREEISTRALLHAASLLADKIELSKRPIQDRIVHLLPHDEEQQALDLQQSLRFAAARFEATSGAWKFAEEIVLATPCDDAARAEELAFVK
ncbi:MAG: protein kinase, partial [Planctomycetes bacterium]|nr:protein kinase [Planctomycetota bacterium]